MYKVRRYTKEGSNAPVIWDSREDRGEIPQDGMAVTEEKKRVQF